MENELREIPDDKIEDFVYKLYEGLNHNPAHKALLDDKKLIACRHEIVISVNARVMEEDDSGEEIGTVQICEQNYRIPVPSNKDHNVFMKAFFDHLEKSMSKSYANAENS